MKNIAIIIPKLAGGGAQRVAANLSINISKTDNVKMVLFSKEIAYPFGGELIILDEQPKGHLYRLAILVVRILETKKIKKSNRIDTAISFMEGAGIVNILSKGKEKVLVSVRSFPALEHQPLREKIRLKMIYTLYRRADKIVVVSNMIKKELVDKYGLNPNSIEVIYNYYNIDEIKKASAEKIEDEYLSVFNDHPVVVSAGRLVKQKGQWHLIRAFKKVLELIPNARLCILGDGRMKNELQGYIEDLQLKESVFLLGYQENPFKFISKSSVFVLSSIYEGFPNALCEAMACGAPVISTDCKSGPREILSPETQFDLHTGKVDLARYGVLTPPLDGLIYKAQDELTHAEGELGKAIAALLQDDSLRDSYARQSEKRIEDFRCENIFQNWMNII